MVRCLVPLVVSMALCACTDEWAAPSASHGSAAAPMTPSGSSVAPATEAAADVAPARPAPEASELTVEEVVALIADRGATILDANSDTTRRELGVVPGAVLLPRARDYDLDLLPAAKDAKLVFYCANTLCSSSHVAARRALRAGYSDVNVMPAGIFGWKEAGKIVQTVAATD